MERKSFRMLSGGSFLIVFVVAIITMIIAIGALRIHPFLAIMATALILALLCLKLDQVVDTIATGFSSAFATIGLVVIIGSLVGLILEHTGAALKMSEVVVRALGTGRPDAALAVMGWLTSISIFCDSGFVILNPVRKAIVKRVKVSSASTSVALATGLFISHCLIPPTPGPLAAAGVLGMENNLLSIMFFGVIVSIPALIVACVFASFIGKRVKDQTELLEAGQKDIASAQTYDELLASYGKTPGAFASFLPILLPLLLIGASSFCTMNHIQAPIVEFLGKPIIALFVGLLASLKLLFSTKKTKELYSLTSNALTIAGPILFITGAGCALGKVVGASPLIPFLTEHSNALSAMGLFFPFVFASILKTAQGSSTVSISTTAAVVAPMLAPLGLDSPALTALTVIAIGAGAMTVSHVNDSYFWVVSKFGEFTKTIDVYKTLTLSTLLVGVTSILTAFVVSLFL